MESALVPDLTGVRVEAYLNWWSVANHVFEKVLSRVMDLPGDWHAGLSMLNSIYLLFYEVLLEPIRKQKLLSTSYVYGLDYVLSWVLI
jgi:hypothetical protein